MKTTNYKEDPIGRVKIVSDFLPSPDKLAFREKSTKITLSLSESTIAFFKQQAAKHHAKYQRMIRTLLDGYVARHSLA